MVPCADSLDEFCPTCNVIVNDGDWNSKKYIEEYPQVLGEVMRRVFEFCTAIEEKAKKELMWWEW